MWDESHRTKTYTPFFRADVKPTPVPKASYTVVWRNGDGSVLDTKTFSEGQAEPTTKLVPTKKEDAENTYVFASWSQGTWNSTHTTKTYTPQFAVKKKEKPKAAQAEGS